MSAFWFHSTVHISSPQKPNNTPLHPLHQWLKLYAEIQVIFWHIAPLKYTDQQHWSLYCTYIECTVLVQYTVCSSFRTVYTSCALLKTTSKPTNDSCNHVSDTKHALREFFFFGFYFREEKKILPNFFGFYSHNVAFTPNTLFYFS